MDPIVSANSENNSDSIINRIEFNNSKTDTNLNNFWKGVTR